MASSSSSSSSYISLHRTQLPPKMQHHHHHFSPFTSQPPQQPPSTTKTHHHKHLLLITTFSLLPFILYLLSLSRSLHPPPSSSFSLIIDLSSSSSRILVFRSLYEVSGTPFSGDSSDSFSLDSGVADFGGNFELVSGVLLKLLAFAKSKVPEFEWGHSMVQLFVSDFQEREDERERESVVLEECRKVLRSSGFLFRDHWASLLNGQEEGLYSWLAVNYALGYLGKKPEETAGVVSLGRSSMQVSFSSPETPASKSSRVIRLAGVSYNLYTQSLQQFGQDTVWKSLHERHRNTQDLISSSLDNGRSVLNPCYPMGYERTLQTSDEKPVKSQATGNFSACKSELTKLLNGEEGKCARAPCEIVPSIFSELESKPHPRQRFFLSSQFRGLVPKASISELESVARHFCEDDWENLKNQNKIYEADLLRSCFSHTFMATLLHNSFGIPFDEKRVEFAAGSTPVDWRLGAFISQTIMEPLENITVHHDTHFVENDSVTVFFLFAVLIAFVLLAAFFVMKLRKPQFKTIYDLEKGHYIVTRVPR